MNVKGDSTCPSSEGPCSSYRTVRSRGCPFSLTDALRSTVTRGRSGTIQNAHTRIRGVEEFGQVHNGTYGAQWGKAIPARTERRLRGPRGRYPTL